MDMRIPVAQVLARVKGMPALPRAVHALNAVLADEQARADRIVDAVSSDQALTITALRLANSSFYGVSGRVATLRDAVQILGLHTLSAAVTTAAVMVRFDRAACPSFDLDDCWRHALATALCARMLAPLRGIDECAAYTVGLLHDVGRLALATHWPEQFAAAIAWGALHDAAPIDAERAVLGIDHAAVGGMVAAHWRLAPVLVETIVRHHEVPGGAPGMPDAAGRMLDLLHLADAVTHALDLSHAPDERVPPLAIEVWERMQVTGAELQALFARLEAAMRELDPALVP